VSADTIVPGAGKPQALNRYGYVFNNPLKYTDPSGHCPFLSPGCREYFLRSQFPFIKGGVKGFIAATAVNMVFQATDDVLHEREIDIDPKEASIAGIGGAVSGGLLALHTPTTLLGTLTWGTIAGTAGNQAARLVPATTEEAANFLNGQGLDGQSFIDNAIKSGVVQRDALFIDAGGAFLAAGAGKLVNSAFNRALGERAIRGNSGPKIVMTGQYKMIDTGERVVYLPDDKWDKLMQLTASGLLDPLTDFISELVGQGSTR
jgi:hypothetical protein